MQTTNLLPASALLPTPFVLPCPPPPPAPSYIHTLLPRQLYPPSGVLPHQGLATLAAPLCYVYEHPGLVYRMHVALYCRYWCR
jgi:hypothetical protein